MTSGIDSLKTDEFLRRRKLRLQQVREQSKDIAKKIRQRADVEKSLHLENTDAKKEKEYLDCQEKLVKHLELLYRKGLKNVGTGHKNALEVSQQEDSLQNIDLSKLRGRDAVVELRRQKQEKLDEQKKLLDRKLQAREAANELSREKSTIVVKKLKPALSKSEVLHSNPDNPSETLKQKDNNPNQDLKTGNIDTAKNDMGTQWDSAELLNEWEPNVPELLLPKDDSVKDLGTENGEKIDKSKKLNLFIVSNEMPTSLRGGLTGVTNEEVPTKTSLTLVSEYLQNRSLRLRQNESIQSSKKADDLQSIKQTILRNRATRTDGNVFDNVCHVLDEQVIPVPSWQAQGNSALCRHLWHWDCCSNSVNKTFSKPPINNVFIPPRSSQRQSSPVLKEVNKIWRTKFLCRTCNQTVCRDKSSHSTELNTGLARKKSISVYNHNTRNMQNVPCNHERFVSRENKDEEDAYAQALKETTIQNTLEKEQSSKGQNELRTKVAVTKQNVDKEYRDTLAFLNTLSRDKNDKSGKVIKTAYMDENQQQMQNERHQQKLQEEFKNIEKECYKRHCKHSKRKSTICENRIKSKSPVQTQATGKEFEYSWMPVPDGDRSFAVHTIPNTKHKSGNTVKFSKNDSYHEYRSRHKHTPPTKDVSGDRQTKRYMEAVIVQQTSDESGDRSSLTSETSSAENLSLNKCNNKTNEDSLLKDADRIIIYKILESKKDKNKGHKMAKLNKINISNDSVTNEINNKMNEAEDNKTQETKKSVKPTGPIKRGVSFEQLQEGVYQAVTNNGDNVTSLYFTEDPKGGDEENHREKLNKTEPCSKDLQIDGGDNTRRLNQASSCKCGSQCRKDKNGSIAQPSAATSATSFTRAVNDKLINRLNEDDILHFIDRTQESSKFYVGASGFLKDDKYEVVIQLRKKETEKDNVYTKQPPSTIPTKSLEIETQEIGKDITSTDLCSSKENVASPPIKNVLNVEVDSTIYNKVQTQNNQETLIDVKSVEQKENSQLNNMCEKDTHMSFQDSYAIPVHVPKLDPISRPATSTYTQTSFNSSIPRPPFMHMSSSTSTAYMSPPELILPKFLKHNYVMTNEEIFESENTMNQLDSNFNDENCKEFSECMCSACVRYNLRTPPNTARSCDKDTSDVKYVGTKKTKCKCHKCRSRSETNIRHKLHTKKCRSMLKTRSSRDLPSAKRNPTSKKIIKNENASPYTKTSGSKLNPTVKNYVNKLLALNREGLKAVEIMNQDCSAITTPGSSIINLSCNVKKDKSNFNNKISLEQVKHVLKQNILNEDLIVKKKTNVENKESQTEKYPKPSLKLPKKKSVHKVKSLNISKNIFKKKKSFNSCIPNQSWKKPSTLYSTSVRKGTELEHNIKKQVQTSENKSSNTRRIHDYSETKNSASSDIADVTDTEPCNESGKNTKKIYELAKNPLHSKLQRKKNINIPLHKATRTSFSSDSDFTGALLRNLRTHTPPSIHISTQTNDIIDAEIKFMKIAEDKLQNMEKIADLTEKCTKRLSNLAKVLEEVRRNKSLVYSQISTSDSTPESESKADKNEGSIEISNERMSDPNILAQNKDISHKLTTLNMPENLDDNYVDHPKGSAEFTTFLKDIPKPVTLKTLTNAPSNLIDSDNQSTSMFIGTENVKSRGKPPPALSRIHLKHGQDIYIVPHELSTVIEVESPMSMKLKSQTSRQDSKLDIIEKSDHNLAENHNELTLGQENRDLLRRKNISRRLSKVSSTDSSDDSKMRMMDLKKFNDIMLKPFITLQEYAKQCNIGLDEGSNLDDINKGEPINDDLSSLHSDGSLPDVVAELLKRKIISEPFKFDTGSNVTSTTFSSESTLSVLALSKGRKEKKKSGMFLENKENIGDNSESLSISSNPDLENAFQKLGMGWASSTLKKTKERLALSSSSNTSSSSMTQFKINNFSPDIPTLASDSASSLLDAQNKQDRKKSNKYIEETSRNAVQQQTSLTNSMTVKEFLTNELAKKITFNNKSSRREAEEFISLYETKMPEEMKHTSKGGEQDQSSVTSVNNNRARTSTPVQIFKSQAYQSSSTSNTSNGFFSNADDLSSVKVTSTSVRNHSTSDKDDLTIPNYSLKTKKSDRSKSD